MPVDNLKAGMRGYAKTVISGDTIETFPVEVLGVTGSESMGYQILIRAGGGVMERSGGIAQGMSGSPVYIDGKLAGAIAYGTAFSDPHYCLLTPIQDMLDLLDKPEPQTFWINRNRTGRMQKLLCCRRVRLCWQAASHRQVLPYYRKLWSLWA